MGDAPNVSGPVRAINAVARILSGMAQAANAAGTLVVLGLVVLINADVISRNALSLPFAGTYEAVQFLLVMIVFLQLPDVIRINRLTRSDGALAMLADRRPDIARFFARIIDAAAGVFMGLIAYAIWPEFLRSWGTGAFFGTPGLFTAPYWPIHLVIFCSCCLACAIFATKALTGRRRPERLHLEESGA